MDYWRALTPGQKAAAITVLLVVWFFACVTVPLVTALTLLLIVLGVTGGFIFLLWFLVREFIKDAGL